MQVFCLYSFCVCVCVGMHVCTQVFIVQPNLVVQKKNTFVMLQFCVSEFIMVCQGFEKMKK